MKKSEILKVLNEELTDSMYNVNNYYRISETNLLVVNCKEISYRSLEKVGDRIIDITARVKDGYIRICFRNVEFD